MKTQPGALKPYPQRPQSIDVTRGTSMSWETTFRDNNLRNHDIDTLKRWVRRKLDGYHVPINSIRADNLLYRGLRWGVRPTKVSEVSYPSADVPHMIGLGRANRDGRAMFYASRAAPAVFYEVRARTGDTIAFSEWGLAANFPGGSHGQPDHLGETGLIGVGIRVLGHEVTGVIHGKNIQNGYTGKLFVFRVRPHHRLDQFEHRILCTRSVATEWLRLLALTIKFGTLL